MTDYQRAAWLEIARKQIVEGHYGGWHITLDGCVRAIAEAVAAHESKAERKLAEIEKLCQEYSLVPRDHILDVLSNEP